ncbi:MAG TPA: response regulator transcription factor, partial [Clostridia bacterium]|nr:response regulator transcription factor [Clostridia bacterium]
EVNKAIYAGADAYLMKEIGSNNLINTIFEVYSGRFILDGEVTKKVIGQLRKTPSQTMDQELLTPQELQILSLVAQGKTNREIAKTLKLTEKTIRNYVSNILNKLGLKNRTEATAYAIKNKLV